MGLSIAILGTGSYAPAKVDSNHDLSKLVDPSGEWITTRTGIRERRIAGHHEPASDLATRAGIAAIADARVTAGDADRVVLAPVTPDMPMPSAACVVQRQVGVPTHAVCVDFNAACTASFTPSRWRAR